jgi:hypothetical protein
VAARAAVTAHRRHERVAATWRDPRRADDRWQSTTWGELGRCWRHGALGLEGRGVALGDLVGVVAEPGPDSMAIDHAVLAAGAASVPVDRDELGKLSRLGVRRIVARQPTALPETASDEFEIIDWDVAVADGASVDGEQPDRFEKLVERIPPDAIGTVDVSAPDVVVRTHAELLWAARSFGRLVALPGDDERDDQTVALVSVRGFVGRTVAQDWPSMTGATVWWPGPLGAVDTIREAQPTVIAAPAETWRVVAGAATAAANGRWLALGRLSAADEPLGRLDRGLHRVLRRLFRTGLQRRLGLDGCKSPMVVGEADRATMRELAAVGIDVRLTWSQAAAGGLVTAGSLGGREPAAVGLPVPGATIRIGVGGIEVRPPGATEWISTDVHGRLDRDGGLHLL